MIFVALFVGFQMLLIEAVDGHRPGARGLSFFHPARSDPLQRRLLDGALADAKSISRSTATSSIERSLLWSQTDRLCTAAEIQATSNSHPDPYHDALCLAGDIQWDPDGILSAYSLTVTVEGETRVGGEVYKFPEPLTVYVAKYMKNDDEFCYNFDDCGTGYFEYDCSNVYCGPNARRDCLGNYEATSCPADVNEADLLDIPTLRKSNCAVFQNSLKGVPDSNCGPCTAGVHDGFEFVDCGVASVGCTDNGTCWVEKKSMLFGEGADISSSCYADNSGMNSFCLNYASPPGSSRGEIERYGCTASLNESACDCTVCGLGQKLTHPGFSLEDVFYKIDCSAVSPNTIANQCDGTYTGIFSLFLEILENSEEGTASLLTTSPYSPAVPVNNPITAQPITTVSIPPPSPLTSLVGVLTPAPAAVVSPPATAASPVDATPAVAPSPEEAYVPEESRVTIASASNGLLLAVGFSILMM